MGLNTLDLAVIAVYLVGVTLFGLRFKRKQRTLKDYFLADNTIPWWAISLSIVAAETSTLTVISVPGLAYDKDFRFLQLVIGYLVGRTIVSFLFIPQYFRGELLTAYQLIERRFGQKLRSLTAGMFLLTRAAAEGVRVFAVAIVVRVALGSLLSGLSDFQRDLSAIGIVTVLTLAYTFEGGMAAVIWTDVIQLTIYIAGTIVGFFPSCISFPADGPPSTRSPATRTNSASSTHPGTSPRPTRCGPASSAAHSSLPPVTAPTNSSSSVFFPRAASANLRPRFSPAESPSSSSSRSSSSSAQCSSSTTNSLRQQKPSPAPTPSFQPSSSRACLTA